MHENRELKAEVATLREQLADWEDSYKMIMDERCSGDQKHCGCVPALKKKIKEYGRTSIHTILSTETER
jgi:hypothetical protein